MTTPTPDSLSRTAKMFADDSSASTLEEAEAMLDGYRLQLLVGTASGNVALQAAVLTIVNSATRAFRGGVAVVVTDDAALTTGWYRGIRLSAAVVALGGTVVEALADTIPTICVGDPSVEVRGSVVLRAVVGGWRAGVVEGVSSPIAEDGAFVLAGVAAGGLAVAEAFEWRRGKNLLAGRRSHGISLWRRDVEWTSDEARGPGEVTYAPASWWLVGLGHLGQGYLWSIGMLPYIDAGAIQVLLQDDDFVTEANESTGLLLQPGSTSGLSKVRKTRLLAERMDGRGFRTTVTERRLGPGDGPRGIEPRLALIGVDNAATRRALSDSEDFELIIDGGLGAGPIDYLDVSIHTFPSSRRSTDIPSWRAEGGAPPPPVDQAAYADRTSRTGDDCGTVEIAGRSVAASFVGATAGALVAAEAVRALRLDHRYEVITTSLRDMDATVSVLADGQAGGTIGFAEVA